MKALVTGGAGFIGSYLIPRLLENGYEVVAFDMAQNPAALRPYLDKITYFKGNLASTSDIYRAMMIPGITDVFHLGSILAEPCEKNPAYGFQVNFQSTMSLLDASLALNLKRFIMISSIAVFDKSAKEPVADDAIKNPANVYGQTKLASEHLLQWYAAKHGLDTRAVRFAWVFGPGRTTGITALYSSLLLDALARGEPVSIDNPDERGDWLYVKDAVKAIIDLWQATNPKQRIYNIAGGVYSIREVVEIANKHLPQAVIKYSKGVPSLSPYPAAYDDSVARREIGWRPDYSIEEAVREHLEAVFRNNG
jgi:UDP-glucose 4-epimerase